MPQQLRFNFASKRPRRSKTPKPLMCHYGTAWLDHFDPPIGTGKGCPGCDGESAAIDARLSVSVLQPAREP
jgi:hypothetical protein